MRKDGRKRAEIPYVLRPHKQITNAQVDRIIDMFCQSGRSMHTVQRTTLIYIVDYCERNKVGYTLKFIPGAGYYIERDDVKKS